MQTETLYSKAIELANLSKKDRILDTYCGIGTIGLIASKKVDEVVGVEIVKDAIKDAKANAALNNINNANFVLADASDFMVDLAKTSEKMDVVFVDPPRKGCDEKFLSSLMKLSPNKIVYISCNPSTLARDLGILKEKYDIRKIQPVDMFPHTYHVETIALLHKKNIYN
jgi:23S rRNA (uracil1939-C5)-methyltransferase